MNNRLTAALSAAVFAAVCVSASAVGVTKVQPVDPGTYGFSSKTNGVANAEALQRALAEGKPVALKGGTFKIARTVRLGTNARLSGNRWTCLSWSDEAGEKGPMFANESIGGGEADTNVCLQSVRIVGSTLSFANMRGLRVDGVTVEGVPGDGDFLRLKDVADATVAWCRVDGGRRGIVVDGVRGFTFRCNSFSNRAEAVAFDGSGSSHGKVSIEDRAVGTDCDGPFCRASAPLADIVFVKCRSARAEPPIVFDAESHGIRIEGFARGEGLENALVKSRLPTENLVFRDCIFGGPAVSFAGGAGAGSFSMERCVTAEGSNWRPFATNGDYRISVYGQAETLEHRRHNPSREATLNPSVVNIQRTMKLLDDSTPEKPAHVRIAFYGQSIVAQTEWTDQVCEWFRRMYPSVKFEFINPSLGGWMSPNLCRTAAADIWPFYPDILFYHVYGPMDKYEELIREMREHTSAEIVVWSSHSNGGESVRANFPEPNRRTKDIAEVARRNGCMFIDLSRKWAQEMFDRDCPPSSLVRDGIHLNADGIDLYAKTITDELWSIPRHQGYQDAAKLASRPKSQWMIRGAEGDSATSGTVTEAPFAATLKFSGNRVVAVSNGKGTPGAKARVLLDGRELASFPTMWTHTRSGSCTSWMPTLKRIGNEVPLVDETWQWRLIEGTGTNADGTAVMHYNVTGSVTGEDGDGWSTNRFVSKSGRVVIEPDDIAIGTFRQFRIPVRPGGRVSWRSERMFTETYEAHTTNDVWTVLVQGCPNGEHVLTLEQDGEGELGIDRFVVYAPPVVGDGAAAANLTPASAMLLSDTTLNLSVKEPLVLADPIRLNGAVKVRLSERSVKSGRYNLMTFIGVLADPQTAKAWDAAELVGAEAGDYRFLCTQSAGSALFTLEIK